MNIKIICKASKTEGLGHLFRSLSLAQYIHHHRPEWNIQFVLISKLNLNHILDDQKLDIQKIPDEASIETGIAIDILIIDMLSLQRSVFEKIKNLSRKTITISPIFNHIEACDILITRTKYFDKNLLNSLEVKAGLKYSIIRPDCSKIDSSHYKSILSQDTFHIAISMGGTDQHNLTYRILERLSEFNGQALFWTILGEGYSHNYHDLVKIIKGNSKHEIILARTNKNMWNILANCSIAIIAGGITSYEAVYAGLPALSFYHDPERAFLTRELVENRLSLNNIFTITDLLSDLNKWHKSKNNLLEIHSNCINEFKTNPIHNVLEVIEETIKSC